MFSLKPFLKKTLPSLRTRAKLCTRTFSIPSGYDSQVTAVLGSQWGDEGKGKLVDILAKHFDVVARFNGGANAGHTLVVEDKKYAFHLLPCGMLYDDTINVIGNGTVVNIPTLFKELHDVKESGISYDGRLLISDRAHLLFEFHKIVDGMQESKRSENSIGTTKKGIGPCYSSKKTRNGLRVDSLMENFGEFKESYLELLQVHQLMYDFEYDPKEELEQLESLREDMKPMVTDTIFYVNNALASGKKILAEGANAAMLDVDFGTYPFVTSSSTTIGGIATGLGIPPKKVGSNIGVVKAYTTRVGWGPFPTELTCDIGRQIQVEGHETGTTTGRDRRCGWLDIPVVQYSHQINGYDSINITKLDVLSNLAELKIGISYHLDGTALKPGEMPSTLRGLGAVEVQYETLPGWQCDIGDARKFSDLPENAQLYLKRIEELLKCPISWVGVGAGREDMATQGFSAL